MTRALAHADLPQTRVICPAAQAFVAESEGPSKADPVPFSSSISNFFQTDAISRASSTMAKCVVARQASQG